MMPKENEIYCRHKNLKIRAEDNDEITIYNPDSGQIHELNTSATFIFRQLTEENKISHIIEKYKLEYDLEFERSKFDVMSAIRFFNKLKLIEKQGNKE
jgi:hypothetical protein